MLFCWIYHLFWAAMIKYCLVLIVLYTMFLTNSNVSVWQQKSIKPSKQFFTKCIIKMGVFIRDVYITLSDMYNIMLTVKKSTCGYLKVAKTRFLYYVLIWSSFVHATNMLRTCTLCVPPMLRKRQYISYNIYKRKSLQRVVFYCEQFCNIQQCLIVKPMNKYCSMYLSAYKAHYSTLHC